jgi:hypothetical protein
VLIFNIAHSPTLPVNSLWTEIVWIGHWKICASRENFERVQGAQSKEIRFGISTAKGAKLRKPDSELGGFASWREEFGPPFAFLDLHYILATHFCFG